MPRKLISDRDPRFLSQFWQALFGAFGVEHNASTTPSSNGWLNRMVSLKCGASFVLSCLLLIVTKLGFGFANYLVCFEQYS